MATYTTFNALYKGIEKEAEKALNKTANDIMALIQRFIYEDFYQEYPDPKRYKRTFQLLESVTRTRLVKNAGTLSIEIYLDPTSADEGYKGGYDPMTIWENASLGKHGEIQTDGRFWQHSIDEITKRYKEFLIKNGLNVV
jgi:hypothetical protein